MVDDVAEGGGTDAAFAALKTKAPVIEGFGLQGFGAHTTDAEYMLIDSIEPRLYLAARMIMDVVARQGSGVMGRRIEASETESKARCPR